MGFPSAPASPPAAAGTVDVQGTATADVGNGWALGNNAVVIYWKTGANGGVITVQDAFVIGMGGAWNGSFVSVHGKGTKITVIIQVKQTKMGQPDQTIFTPPIEITP